MTRDEHLQAILDIAYKPLLLQIGTGVGKTRIAIELLKKWDAKKIFILVPKIALKQSWEDEFVKWNYDTTDKTIEIQCYASIHKFGDTQWDASTPWPKFEYEKPEIVTGHRRWWDPGYWTNKWYLDPVSRIEIQKGYGLTQNPGW
jgi:hypothetical protein